MIQKNFIVFMNSTILNDEVIKSGILLLLLKEKINEYNKK